jgi:hypothetical protein
LRDVNTICRRSWYIAAHIWKIYNLKIEVVPFSYEKIRLIRSLKKFIFRYQDLVEIYSVSVEKIISDGFANNQLRDVNTICRRSWYIAAHIWKIYNLKIEVVPFIKNFSTDLTTVVKFEV